MTEREHLARYVNEICGERLIEPRFRETLYQLLAVPRIRERYSGLTWEDIREIAERQILPEEAVRQPPRRSRRKTA